MNSEIVSLYTKTKLMLDYSAQIAGGLCDNLLTCIMRVWDYSKPLFVALAMNTLMWNNPFTEHHLQTINQLGIILIPQVTKRLACGDHRNGAMAETSQIYTSVRLAWKTQPHVQAVHLWFLLVITAHLGCSV